MSELKFCLEYLAAGSAQMILAAVVAGLVIWHLRREKEVKMERAEFRAADSAEREKLIGLVEKTSAIAADCSTALTRVSNVIEHCIRKQGQ